jgi:purine catabolism regulator
MAIKSSEALSDFDRRVRSLAVTIVALELLRGRVAGNTEWRLAGDLLSAVLAGELQGSELACRLTPFGLRDSVVTLVSSAEMTDPLVSEGERVLAAPHNNLICALIPGRDAADLFALAGRLTQRVETVVGVGRAVDVDRAPS